MPESKSKPGSPVLDTVPRINFQALSQEQQERVDFLESHTDKIYELRTQLASFFRQYRRPLYDSLGTEFTTKNGGFLATLASIEKQMFEGKSLDTLLTLEEDGTEERYIANIELVCALERALSVYQELKNTKESARIQSDGSDGAEIDRYYSMRFQELGQAMWVRTEMQEEARRLESMREKVIEKGAKPLVIRAIDQKIVDLQGRAKAFFESRPEAWIVAHGMRLNEMKQIFDSRGRIVETPYVASKMRQVETALTGGRPVFLIGELGSGKTELARQLSYKTLSLPHLARWDKAHPAPQEDTEEHASWSAEREAQREPVVISGHRALEADALFASREVRRKDAPSPEDQVQYIRERWEAQRESAQQKYSVLNPSELAHERDLFEKGCLELFRAPIETRTVLGGLLQAMQEGRPFILDLVSSF